MTNTITPEQRREAKRSAETMVANLRDGSGNAFDRYSDAQIWYALINADREGLKIGDAIAIFFFDHILDGFEPPSAHYWDHPVDAE